MAGPQVSLALASSAAGADDGCDEDGSPSSSPFNRGLRSRDPSSAAMSFLSLKARTTGLHAGRCRSDNDAQRPTGRGWTRRPRRELSARMTRGGPPGEAASTRMRAADRGRDREPRRPRPQRLRLGRPHEERAGAPRVNAPSVE